MPEGPSVRLIAERLQKYLPGYYITNIGSNKDYNIHIQLPRQIRGVTVKGKKIIFMLDSDIYLVNSLGMTGDWGWERTKHSHLWLDLSRPTPKGLVTAGTAYYNDMRKFGSFVVYNSTQQLLDSFKNKVGPDILGEVITYDQWKPIAISAGPKQVCQFLIDQKYFSGVGNKYRSEIAYHARINPVRLISSLSEEELVRLYNSSIAVMRDAYYKLRDNPAEYTEMVYKKKVDPYGNAISTTTCKDRRKLFWVPEIQS